MNSYSPEERAIIRYAEQVQRGELDPLIAAQFAVDLGFLLIGTALTDVDLHIPPPPKKSRYFDIDLNQWTSVAENEKEMVLRATDNPKHAAAGALFGDPNDRGQRKRLSGANGSLTDLPPPHFGWSRDGREVHAILELIEEVDRRGESIIGSIDVIRRDDSFWPLIFEVNEFLSPKAHQTIAHIHVNGKHLPPDIVPVIYE